MLENKSSEEFHISLDCDNVLDSRGCEEVWALLRSKWAMPTYPYQFYRAKGKDAGVTGRVGCFTSAFFALRGYDQSLWGAGYQDMDFVRRLEARMMEWPELNSQRGSSFKENATMEGISFSIRIYNQRRQFLFAQSSRGIQRLRRKVGGRG